MSSPRDTRVEDRTLTEALAALARAELAGWLRSQRWFGAKGRAIDEVAVADSVTLDESGGQAVALALLDVTYGDSPGAERYAAPLAIAAVAAAGGGGGGTAAARAGTEGEAPAEATAPIGVARVEGAAGLEVRDATDLDAAPRALFALIAAEARRQTTLGALLVGRKTRAAGFAGEAVSRLPVRRMRGEQSNTSYRLGDDIILKVLRRLQPGVHPDAEVTAFLTRAGFPHSPQLLGELVYQTQGHHAETTTLALVQEFVPSRGDAWKTTLADLATVLGGRGDVAAAVAPLERLGEITGELHATLASDASAADFAPEPLDDRDREQLAAAIERRAGEIAAVAARADQQSPGSPGAAAPAWPQPVREALARLGARAQGVAARVRAEAAAALPAGMAKIRVHGDYHLGQVLATEAGSFAVIDFEGEPARPLAARRAKDSPLRDVAGMLRSFNYASHVARREVADVGSALLAESWEAAAREAFLRGYLARVGRAAAQLVPSDPAALERALALFELDKALYEVNYEINNRPDWVTIPLEGAERAVAALEG